MNTIVCPLVKNESCNCPALRGLLPADAKCTFHDPERGVDNCIIAAGGFVRMFQGRRRFPNEDDDLVFVPAGLRRG